MRRTRTRGSVVGDPLGTVAAREVVSSGDCGTLGLQALLRRSVGTAKQIR